MRKIVGLSVVLVVFFACRPSQVNKADESVKVTASEAVVSTPKKVIKTNNKIEQLFLQAGLVDITSVDSSLVVDIKYGTTDNFVGVDMYDGLRICYLQKEVATKLAKAQSQLKSMFPYLSIVVYDGARPQHVQQMMWDKVKLSVQEKGKFLSNPAYGSVHNYGAAVDVSIINLRTNQLLDMGTSFDYLGELAYPVLEQQHLSQGLLTKAQVENRQLLRSVMRYGGFSGIDTEWWHYNACSRKKAKEQFVLLQLKEKAAPVGDISVGNIQFKVQLVSLSILKATNPSHFSGLKVSYYQQDNAYKYTAGNFSRLADAYAFRDKVRKETPFTEAFIVAFNNKERITVKEAVELLN